jgi:hypothetical protein
MARGCFRNAYTARFTKLVSGGKIMEFEDVYEGDMK